MSLRFTLIAAFCGSLAAGSALAQDTPAVEPTPSPSPSPAATPQVEEIPEGGLIGRSARSYLNDDESEGKGRGIHYGPFAPRVEILSSGGGPAGILHFWTPNIGGSPFDIHATAAYSIYKYQYYDTQIGLLPHKEERLPNVETGTNAIFPLADLEKTSGIPGFNIYAAARYRDYTREDYYGIGQNAPRAAHADYRLQDGLYEGVIRFQVSRLSLMGRAGLLKTTILAGDDDKLGDVAATFNDTTAPGLTTAPDFITMSGGAWLELRDEPGNPHKGAAFGGSFTRFNDRNASQFQFNRIALEGRQYLPLFSPRHVLAFKQTLSMDDADDGMSIPFYMRTTLGGGSVLRSYPSFRFRDDRLLYLIGEYRFEVTRRVELAAIYEGGKVFPETQGVNFKNLRTGYGGGIRIKSSRKVLVRFDVLHGDEGNRYHIKLGRSF